MLTPIPAKNHSFTLQQDEAKYPHIDMNTIQTKKKRKCKRKKNNSKVDISESNRNRSQHDTINIPQRIIAVTKISMVELTNHIT